METISYSNFRQKLRSFINKINDDAERLTVTTNDNQNIVVMSETDYNAWMETLYLMSSKTNRERIDSSINQLNDRKGTIHELYGVEND
ncbi:MAG: type II toxin-antitoxin system Phd/YefM family antitoxin [Lachnospiraceae bacterium]|nr:type II toxin-antitoxin system Phd/YefM family antitoxin [Lachnospiraceae bacterium]